VALNAVVAAAGQSNAFNWFIGQRDGLEAFLQTAASAGVDVTLVNAAVGSRGLVAGSDVLWTDFDGALYQGLLSEVGARHLDALIFVQGEQDASVHVSSPDYLAGLQALAARARADFGPGLVIVITELRTPPDRADADYAEIRVAQAAFVANDTHAVLVSVDQQLAYFGGIHFTGPSYSVLADASARATLELIAPSSTPTTIDSGSALADSRNDKAPTSLAADRGACRFFLFTTRYGGAGILEQPSAIASSAAV
jgi:hypothetical protein